MSLIQVALVVALLGMAGALSMERKINPELDVHWESFKTTYNKQYDEQFELVRRIIWESNIKYIQSHNLAYDEGKHSYALGMNKFGDLTHQEFKALYMGLKQSPKNRSTDSLYMKLSNVKDLPDTVDWRTKGYVTPVKDQGQCGSCWAFSATGSLEGQYFRKSSTLVSFSEQQLVDCSKSFGNQGCNGGLMDQAFDYIKSKGIEREEDYPYTARDGKCKFNAAKVVTKDAGHTDIPQGDENSLKEAVATVGPISVAIDASHSSFQFYKHGVYDESACSSTELDHGVLAAGYGTDNGNDYWLVKNSWGGSWGQKGYIWMSRGKDNQCGIATAASYPLL